MGKCWEKLLEAGGDLKVKSGGKGGTMVGSKKLPIKSAAEKGHSRVRRG